MKTARILLLAAMMVFSCGWVTAEPTPPQQNPEWSEPVEKLSGRLTVANPRIKSADNFKLALELKNGGGAPLAVQRDNPHFLLTTVTNSRGDPVTPTSTRVDVLSSPVWEVISSQAQKSFPVSLENQEDAVGSTLDTTTLIWKLPPGKYRISGEFHGLKEAGGNPHPDNTEIWVGIISLPPIEVEVIGNSPTENNHRKSK